MPHSRGSILPLLAVQGCLSAKLLTTYPRKEYYSFWLDICHRFPFKDFALNVLILVQSRKLFFFLFFVFNADLKNIYRLVAKQNC